MARKAVIRAGKLAMTGGLLVWLAGKVDVGAAWREAAGIDLPLLLAAFGVMMLQAPIGGLRWASCRW